MISIENYHIYSAFSLYVYSKWNLSIEVLIMVDETFAFDRKPQCNLQVFF